VSDIRFSLDGLPVGIRSPEEESGGSLIVERDILRYDALFKGFL
jgi:hypothetical protein